LVLFFAAVLCWAFVCPSVVFPVRDRRQEAFKQNPLCRNTYFQIVPVLSESNRKGRPPLKVEHCTVFAARRARGIMSTPLKKLAPVERMKTSS
tara:strand:+ start:268 stop:546 length:279 start_codon:yes stop_codon:yes gene_type:complete